MKSFISMLRGINVSRQNRINMADLRNIYERLHMTDVKTYVQSGNVVFDSLESDPLKVAKSIEDQIQQTFGYSIKVFVRRQEDFERLLSGNPFLLERNEDTTKLHVTFFYSAPIEMKINDITSPNKDGDEFFFAGTEVFLFCPHGYGKTKLNNNFFERRSGVPATTRNWNTINALYNLIGER